MKIQNIRLKNINFLFDFHFKGNKRLTVLARLKVQLRKVWLKIFIEYIFIFILLLVKNIVYDRLFDEPVAIVIE